MDIKLVKLKNATRDEVLSYVPSEKIREKITMMVFSGMSLKAISGVLTLSENIIKRHYRFELEHGKEIVCAMVANKLVDRAMQGDTKACQYILSTKGKDIGWASDIKSEDLDEQKRVISMPPVVTEETWSKIINHAHPIKIIDEQQD